MLYYKRIYQSLFYQRSASHAFEQNAKKTGGRKDERKTYRFRAEPLYSLSGSCCREYTEKYWERKYRLQGREFAQEELLDRKYTDFEEQYRAYVGEHTDFIFRDWQRFGELLALLESDRLAKAISRLKDRDRVLLFARVYGELTFAELGEKFQMEPKQAEMAYYYVLRKLRKELNGKDEF